MPDIQTHLNVWLNTPQFRPIDRQLRQNLEKPFTASKASSWDKRSTTG
ncbi:MAG: hypothetical protein KME11_05330 [Timaviella obliquedivisa GSE-PSE-MK23-08B]|nr:hypothetical protein [Timaviella obliquedivisa GSE-PSE-MK23-08B]